MRWYGALAGTSPRRAARACACDSGACVIGERGRALFVCLLLGGIMACSSSRPEPGTTPVAQPQGVGDEGAPLAGSIGAGAPPVHADREVYAAGDQLERDGEPFVFRGVNGPAPWGANYKPYYRGPLSSLRFNGIAKMAALGANAMRIIHFIGGTLPARIDLAKSVAEVNRLGMVPVLGVWDRTCATSPTAEVEAFWLSGPGATLAKRHPNLVINPYNELNFVLGEKQTDHAAWAAYYTDFVRRLRAAGIHNLVMIDAGGKCGQNPEGILAHGQAMVEADPAHNLVFSVHMYAYWETDDPLGHWIEGQWSVQEWTDKLAGAGVPVVFGEFGGHDPKTGQNYDVEVVLGACGDGIDGRLFWMDFDGDSKPFYGVYTDLTWSELTPMGEVIADWLKRPCELQEPLNH